MCVPGLEDVLDSRADRFGCIGFASNLIYLPPVRGGGRGHLLPCCQREGMGPLPLKALDGARSAGFFQNLHHPRFPPCRTSWM